MREAKGASESTTGKRSACGVESTAARAKVTTTWEQKFKSQVRNHVLERLSTIRRKEDHSHGARMYSSKEGKRKRGSLMSWRTHAVKLNQTFRGLGVVYMLRERSEKMHDLNIKVTLQGTEDGAEPPGWNGSKASSSSNWSWMAWCRAPVTPPT